MFICHPRRAQTAGQLVTRVVRASPGLVVRVCAHEIAGHLKSILDQRRYDQRPSIGRLAVFGRGHRRDVHVANSQATHYSEDKLEGSLEVCELDAQLRVLLVLDRTQRVSRRAVARAVGYPIAYAHSHRCAHLHGREDQRRQRHLSQRPIAQRTRPSVTREHVEQRVDPCSARTYSVPLMVASTKRPVAFLPAMMRDGKT
jgi:hypothetical protein